MTTYENDDFISGDAMRDAKQEENTFEMCADNQMRTEATHESHNMELCSDCYSEVIE